MADVNMKIETAQSRTGVKMTLYGCVTHKQFPTGERCTELDSLEFNMDDRKAGKHLKVRDVIANVYSGEYENKTCDKLGFNYKDGQCVEKPKQKQQRQKQEQKKQAPEKTVMKLPKRKK